MKFKQKKVDLCPLCTVYGCAPPPISLRTPPYMVVIPAFLCAPLFLTALSISQFHLISDWAPLPNLLQALPFLTTPLLLFGTCLPISDCASHL